MKKPVWRLELQKAFPRQRGIMVGVHDRQPMSSLIKVLELTGRRRFALRAVASCLWAAPEKQSYRFVSRVRLILSGRIAHEIDPPFDWHEVDDGLVLRRERLNVSSAVLVRFSIDRPWSRTRRAPRQM